ncbi:MAG: hypothetical protein D3926_15645 [Desulfobacteraceae bacterium]|nr:MAG: hypothetical protein D3926_15645 [Desulfobacteraceae bacterium]
MSIHISQQFRHGSIALCILFCLLMLHANIGYTAFKDRKSIDHPSAKSTLKARQTAWRSRTSPERFNHVKRFDRNPGSSPVSEAYNVSDCRWAEGFGSPGPDGPVYASTTFDDGTGTALYVGGLFETAGGIPALSIARWDGTTWSPLGAGIYGEVYTLAVFDDGSGPALYAGGFFIEAGGMPATHLAKWDGTTWTAVGGFVGIDSAVLALAVHDEDGTGPNTQALYVGGDFITAGGVTVNGIARWDGTNWSALGTGMSDMVLALTVFDADGAGPGQPALYAGGAFETAGGTSAYGIARWDGTAWSALGDGMDDWVESLAVYDDGTGDALYAGGFFTTAYDPGPTAVPAQAIARWDGTSWSTLGAGIDDEVITMAVFDDGSGPALYAGGYFTTAGGVPTENIARWDGAAWSAVGSGLDDFVWTLCEFDPGTGGARLFAGGDFNFSGTQPVSFLGQWQGTSWDNVIPPGSLLEGFNNPVSVLGVFDDGSGPALYAGGSFTAAGDIPIKGVGRWNGTSWEALGSGLDCSPGFDPPFPVIYAMTVFNDGTGDALYVGGEFNRAGGMVVSGIARWDGTSWSSPGTGVAASAGLGISHPVVEALAVFDNGSGSALYAGGEFDRAGGVPAGYIARWDGASWSALGTGLDGDVEALAVFDNGGGAALYAGGEFTSAGGNSANHVAKWDGTAWSALGSGTDDEVESLAVVDLGSGDALYAGGDFVNAGGISAAHIARWDGTAWSGLGSGMSDEVEAMAAYNDGGTTVLYAAGDFATAGGIDVWGIARWDGTAWSALGEGLGYHGDALTVFDDGAGAALYVGGYFTIAGNTPSSFIAKWHCPTLDYGDAPATGYPSLFTQDGARHRVVPGFFLGTDADAELDGFPSTGADGDDLNGTSDEDGVVFTQNLVVGAQAEVVVTASAPGKLNVWIDMNQDSDWLDPGENVINGADLFAGSQTLGFLVPSDAVPGTTFVRFRFSSTGSTLPTGIALDGEVEDHPVTVVTVSDFGDAPDPDFPTLLASNGPNHTLGSTVYLGSCVDAETDGQPAAGSDGDDLNTGTHTFGTCGVGGHGNGVIFHSSPVAGENAALTVQASAPCDLSAWIDFNLDGDWDDAGEHIFNGYPLNTGNNPLTFPVPAGAMPGNTHARFRCTTDGSVPYTGPASDGEVEDYQVTLINTDIDGDGVSNIQESGPDGTDPGYDGNSDGIADMTQPHVASLHSDDGSAYVTLVCPHPARLENVHAVSNPSPGNAPLHIDFPFGFFSFRITGISPGNATTLTMILPFGTGLNSFWKFGPTPDNPVNQWYDFLYDSISNTGAVISGTEITIHFTDGMRGDHDLSPNGVITDPGGPGMDSPDIPSLSEWGMIILGLLLAYLSMRGLPAAFKGENEMTLG